MSRCLSFYHSTLVETGRDTIMDLMVENMVVNPEVDEDMMGEQQG